MHPPYPARPGYMREEAIMILRRFYLTENKNGTSAHGQLNSFHLTMYIAPIPKSKANRVLKTVISEKGERN